MRSQTVINKRINTLHQRNIYFSDIYGLWCGSSLDCDTVPHPYGDDYPSKTSMNMQKLCLLFYDFCMVGGTLPAGVCLSFCFSTFGDHLSHLFTIVHVWAFLKYIKQHQHIFNNMFKWELQLSVKEIQEILTVFSHDREGSHFVFMDCL